MKRNFKKTIAFALATVTVVANLGVATPVTAAEYEPMKDVLPTEYENYDQFNDGVMFASRTEVKKTDGESQLYVDELVFVDENGEKSTMEVKNTDGSYKYTNISWVSEDCMAMIYDDDTYALYFADGTWFGNGTERYKDICILADGNFLVTNDTTCNVVDKTGKVILKDIFTPTDSEYAYWWPNYEFNDYLILGRSDYVDDENVCEIKMLDKDYKQVTTIDFADSSVSVFDDTYIGLRADKTITFYDASLKKLDYVYKRDIVTNPSASTDSDRVVVDYTITGVWSMYDYNGKRDVIEISMNCKYEDVLGNTSTGYESVYLDMKTFAEIDPEDIGYGSESTEDNSIANTDLSVKDIENGFAIYNGATELYDYNDITDVARELLSLSEDAYVSTGMCTGASGNLFMGISAAPENGEADEYTLMLSKADNYSLEKATIYEKGIYSYNDCLGGMIGFDDETTYFNGKWYDAYTDIGIFGRYDYELGEYYVSYYSVMVTKDDVITSTLYDKNHTELAKVSDEICWVTDKGHIITVKDVVDEEGYSNRYFGCKYVKKTLVSSEDVIEELGKVDEGETVEVEVKKNEPIKAQVFEEMKGKDITLEITTPSGITWTVNGKDIMGTNLKDIDFTVDIVKDIVPAAAIDDVKLEGERIELSLAHSGDFGFTATLKINLKAENTGKFANLFYYNPTTKKLEFQESSKIDVNGNAGFKYTHASDYVIILSDVAYDESPDTADVTNVGMLIAVLAVAAGAVLVMQKKRVSVK